MGLEVLAAAAVVTAGVAVYSATQKPSSPSIPEPPAPANATQYNDDGTVTTQVYDKTSNTYTTKTTARDASTLTEEEKANIAQQKVEKEARTKLRGELLAKLETDTTTPTAERLKMYDDYATALSDQMHVDADYRFGQIQNKNRANLEATGMTGSKAYADILADEARTKALSDTDIAQKATVAKENLAAQDKQFALNDRNVDISLLANLDNGQNADVARQISQNRAVQDTISNTNASLTGNYLANSNNIMSDYQARLASNAANTKTMTDTSKGLAFLYGYQSNKSPTSTGSLPYTDSNPYQFMEGPGSYNMGVAT